jgi:adenine-specific DNA-methyltransferase
MQINSGGFVRLGSFNGTQTPIYYIKPGERKKIAQGVYPILGYAEDGSLITEESESTDYRMVPPTQWRIKSHDSTQYGTRLLSQFLGGNKFSFPKSLYAVEDTIRFFVANKPSALIIDFFSGSGTTAHATMRLNHQDGGNRRCICITNNEVSEAEAKKMTKQGFRQGDSEWEQYGICEYITKPRIEAAITGLTPEGNPIKGDYKFTDEFPMADGFEENAIFFDLTYQNPVVVDLDGAYEEVAPLLWMRAGCKGPIIETRGDGTYELSETYAILFNYAFAQDFVMELDARPEIQTVYVVTDDEGRYQSINQALKGRDVVQLYESYLRSFQIAAEGALI